MKFNIGKKIEKIGPIFFHIYIQYPCNKQRATNETKWVKLKENPTCVEKFGQVTNATRDFEIKIFFN